MIMRREEEIIKASREYAMNKSNEKNTWFVDYRGLIEKGLAIDATNLNIY